MKLRFINLNVYEVVTFNKKHMIPKGFRAISEDDYRTNLQIKAKY